MSVILQKEHSLPSVTPVFLFFTLLTNWLCDSEQVKLTVSFAFIYFRQIACEKKAVACLHSAWDLKKGGRC